MYSWRPGLVSGVSKPQQRGDITMRTKWQVAILASILMLVMSGTMWAGTNLGMQMSTTSPTGSVTLCDNNVNYAGCTGNASDLNPALGQITFIGGVGGWSNNVTSGFGPPYENLVPLLDISTFNATTGGGAGPLTVLLSVSGITSFQGLLNVIDSIGGTSTYAGTTITTQAWLSPANNPFCASTSCGAVALTSALTETGGIYSGKMVGSGTFPNNPFAITLAVTINSQGNPDTTSFDNEFDIPEPAALSLLGSGLLGFGMAFRKKLLGV